MTDLVLGCCGKLEKREDPYRRTLQLSTYWDPKLAAIPIYREWSTAVAQYEEFHNYTIGTCVVASAGHAVQTWSANDGNPCRVTADDVLEVYSAISGYVPGRPETDRGAYMLDMLRWWKASGLAGHRLQAYLEVDPRDILQLRYAIEIGGCVYGGFRLPETAKGERIWNRTDGIAGSWGGHAMAIVNHSPHEFGLPTWARLQRATVEFVQTFCDECYVPIPIYDWTGSDGRAPNGLDVDRIRRDLERVTA